MYLTATFMAVALASEPATGEWHAGAGFADMASSVRADVEDYVSTINMFKRPFARRALVRATAPCAQVSIRDTTDGLAITCNDRKIAIAPSNGTRVQYTGDDGKTLGLIHDIDASGAVTQTFISRRGTRTNRFVQLRDGGLRMEVSITSSLLDRPLNYNINYEP